MLPLVYNALDSEHAVVSIAVDLSIVIILNYAALVGSRESTKNGAWPLRLHRLRRSSGCLVPACSGSYFPLSSGSRSMIYLCLIARVHEDSDTVSEGHDPADLP